MSKRAIVLSGGKGTRLRPYTVVLPKPLMPIGEYPILEIVIRQLARNGFDKITMAVNHQADLIQTFFGNGKKWGVSIDYSIEDKPLSTMGPLKLIRDLPENFLVMNGDILTDFNYRGFYDYHLKSKGIFTVAAHRKKHRSEYGVLEIDKSDRLTGFKEKPVVEYQISMGIYMANRKVLEHIPDDRPYGFDVLMMKLIEMGEPVSVCHHEGRWLDIGNPDDYNSAAEEFEKNKSKFLSER